MLKGGEEAVEGNVEELKNDKDALKCDLVC